MGIPRSWDFMDKMPKGGILEVAYKCAPEERNFKHRKACLETFGSSKMTQKEEDVMWWSAIQEAPEDVLEYLEFLTSRYKDIYAAFTFIDGEDGNGNISWSEFEEGYRAMGCKKFAGPDERLKLKNVFRYLDPSGEGQVSKDEWGVLELLWKEIRLSISEFVQFCNRAFGNDLELWWSSLDEDGSGEIDEEEWVTALQDAGFFGPARPIFAYLDKDDEGTVSFDEFEALYEFTQQKKQTRQSSAAPCDILREDYASGSPESQKSPKN